MSEKEQIVLEEQKLKDQKLTEEESALQGAVSHAVICYLAVLSSGDGGQQMCCSMMSLVVCTSSALHNRLKSQTNAFPNDVLLTHCFFTYAWVPLC